MTNFPSNLSKAEGLALYLSLLDRIQTQIEQQAPGTFTFQIKPTNPGRQAVGGLLVQKAGLDGYCHVFPVFEHELTENWRLIIKDTLQEYSAHFFKTMPGWEIENGQYTFQHFDENFLEAINSPNPVEIADKVVEWAFPRPRQPILPIGPEVLLQLKVIAHGRRIRFTDGERMRSHQLRRQGRFAEACNAVGLVIDLAVNELINLLTPESRILLDADLRHLLPDRLVWHFPSQKDGRWPLRQRVLLATYDTVAPLGRYRKIALVVMSPTRRSEQQVLHLQLASVIPENHHHRWESARWFWDERANNATAAERWGISDLPIALLQQPRAEALSYLKTLWQRGKCSVGERAAYAILLQDEGKFDEALDLFGISIGPNLWKLLGNEKVYLKYCHYPITTTWLPSLQRSMWQCAPWLLLPGLQAAVERLEPWRSADRGRRIKIPSFRLFALRGQRDARKVSLSLSATNRMLEHAEFELNQTGSNRRLPEVCWQRTLEIDFLRFGVLQGILSG